MSVRTGYDTIHFNVAVDSGTPIWGGALNWVTHFPVDLTYARGHRGANSFLLTSDFSRLLLHVRHPSYLPILEAWTSIFMAAGAAHRHGTPLRQQFESINLRWLGMAWLDVFFQHFAQTHPYFLHPLAEGLRYILHAFDTFPFHEHAVYFDRVGNSMICARRALKYDDNGPAVVLLTELGPRNNARRVTPASLSAARGKVSSYNAVCDGVEGALACVLDPPPLPFSLWSRKPVTPPPPGFASVTPPPVTPPPPPVTPPPPPPFAPGFASDSPPPLPGPPPGPLRTVFLSTGGGFTVGSTPLGADANARLNLGRAIRGSQARDGTLGRGVVLALAGTGGVDDALKNATSADLPSEFADKVIVYPFTVGNTMEKQGKKNKYKAPVTAWVVELAAWLHQLCRSEKVPLFVFGFSRGAAWGSELLRIHPDFFAGGVLLGNYPLYDGADNQRDAAVNLVGSRARLVVTHGAADEFSNVDVHPIYWNKVLFAPPGYGLGERYPEVMVINLEGVNHGWVGDVFDLLLTRRARNRQQEYLVKRSLFQIMWRHVLYLPAPRLSSQQGGSRWCRGPKLGVLGCTNWGAFTCGRCSRWCRVDAQPSGDVHRPTNVDSHANQQRAVARANRMAGKWIGQQLVPQRHHTFQRYPAKQHRGPCARRGR